jgi:hypothetical protein
MAEVNTGYHVREDDGRVISPSGRELDLWINMEDSSDHAIYTTGSRHTGWRLYPMRDPKYRYIYDSGDHITDYYLYADNKFYGPDAELPFLS